MSMPSIKRTSGAPDKLVPGMVLRNGSEVLLVGSADVEPAYNLDIQMLSGNPVLEHSQLVEPYMLDWLGSDGLVRAAVKEEEL